MIFAASWAVSTRLHNLFRRFAPSNILIRRVHTRTGIKWGPLVSSSAILRKSISAETPLCPRISRRRASNASWLGQPSK